MELTWSRPASICARDLPSTCIPDEILIELPHAQILSIEQKQLEVLTLENGLWNRISPDDIQAQLAALPEQARQRATALPAEAEQTFTRQLLGKISPRAAGACNLSAPAPRG